MRRAWKSLAISAVEVGIRLGQTIHEVQGRNRIGLEGRRVKRGFAGPIPAGEQRFAGRECAEGNGVVHERFVEDDDVGDDFVKDAARAAREARPGSRGRRR